LFIPQIRNNGNCFFGKTSTPVTKRTRYARHLSGNNNDWLMNPIWPLAPHKHDEFDLLYSSANLFLHRLAASAFSLKQPERGKSVFNKVPAGFSILQSAEPPTESYRFLLTRRQKSDHYHSRRPNEIHGLIVPVSVGSGNRRLS
jgi:hypothetical protein